MGSCQSGSTGGEVALPTAIVPAATSTLAGSHAPLGRRHVASKSALHLPKIHTTTTTATGEPVKEQPATPRREYVSTTGSPVALPSSLATRKTELEATVTVLDDLRLSAFASVLPPAVLSDFARFFQIQHATASEVIFAPGEEASDLYLVRSGVVAIRAERKFAPAESSPVVGPRRTTRRIASVTETATSSSANSTVASFGVSPSLTATTLTSYAPLSPHQPSVCPSVDLRHASRSSFGRDIGGVSVAQHFDTESTTTTTTPTAACLASRVPESPSALLPVKEGPLQSISGKRLGQPRNGSNGVDDLTLRQLRRRSSGLSSSHLPQDDSALPNTKRSSNGSTLLADIDFASPHANKRGSLRVRRKSSAGSLPDTVSPIVVPEDGAPDPDGEATAAAAAEKEPTRDSQRRLSIRRQSSNAPTVSDPLGDGSPTLASESSVDLPPQRPPTLNATRSILSQTLPLMVKTSRETFGQEAFRSHQQLRVTFAVAESPCVLLTISTKDFANFLAGYPEAKPQPHPPQPPTEEEKEESAPPPPAASPPFAPVALTRGRRSSSVGTLTSGEIRARIIACLGHTIDSVLEQHLDLSRAKLALLSSLFSFVHLEPGDTLMKEGVFGSFIPAQGMAPRSGTSYSHGGGHAGGGVTTHLVSNNLYFLMSGSLSCTIKSDSVSSAKLAKVFDSAAPITAKGAATIGPPMTPSAAGRLLPAFPSSPFLSPSTPTLATSAISPSQVTCQPPPITTPKSSPLASSGLTSLPEIGTPTATAVPILFSPVPRQPPVRVELPDLGRSLVSPKPPASIDGSGGSGDGAGGGGGGGIRSSPSSSPSVAGGSSQLHLATLGDDPVTPTASTAAAPTAAASPVAASSPSHPSSPAPSVAASSLTGRRQFVQRQQSTPYSPSSPAPMPLSHRGATPPPFYRPSSSSSASVPSLSTRPPTNPGFLGELGLILDIPRTATIRALSDCVLLELQQDRFRNFLQLAPEVLQLFRARASSSYQIHILHLLNQPVVARAFVDFCRGEHSVENFMFWQTTTSFRASFPKHLLHSARNKRAADDIVERFILAEGEMPVNLRGHTSQTIIARWKANQIDSELFVEAEEEVLALMNDDSFKRFKRSEAFQKCLQEINASHLDAISSGGVGANHANGGGGGGGSTGGPGAPSPQQAARAAAHLPHTRSWSILRVHSTLDRESPTPTMLAQQQNAARTSYQRARSLARASLRGSAGDLSPLLAVTHSIAAAPHERTSPQTAQAARTPSSTSGSKAPTIGHRQTKSSVDLLSMRQLSALTREAILTGKTATRDHTSSPSSASTSSSNSSTVVTPFVPDVSDALATSNSPRRPTAGLQPFAPAPPPGSSDSLGLGSFHRRPIIRLRVGTTDLPTHPDGTLAALVHPSPSPSFSSRSAGGFTPSLDPVPSSPEVAVTPVPSLPLVPRSPARSSPAADHAGDSPSAPFVLRINQLQRELSAGQPEAMLAVHQPMAGADADTDADSFPPLGVHPPAFYQGALSSPVDG